MATSLPMIIYVGYISDMLSLQAHCKIRCLQSLLVPAWKQVGGSSRPSVAHDVCCATQKEESQAKAKKAAEAEEAQKKLADIMVEAQKKVGHWVTP